MCAVLYVAIVECNYSGSKSSPNSVSLNSSSSAGFCLATVLGLSGNSPSGSTYVRKSDL